MKHLQPGSGRSRALSLSGAFLGIGLLISQTSQSIAAEDKLEEVTITGSRIKHATDFDTASPTTVLDADYFKNNGVVNVGDAVKMLPSNISTFAPTNTGNSNFFAGSTIANLRGLNPFFGSRTLSLVNGRRFVPTNQGDGVDLNFIPAVLIERMDVVTGGASAAYGSGAISGVNNIFLNRKLQGAKAEADYGESSHGGDAKDRHFGLAFGTGFAGERGHFTIGYEHEQLDAVGCLQARDWCAEGWGVRQNEVAGGPTYVLDSNLHTAQLNYAGVWQNFAYGAFPTQAVNDAGTALVPFDVGTGNALLPFNAVKGSDGLSIYEHTNLRSPVKRDVGAATFTFKLTDSLNLSIDASVGTVKTDQRTGTWNPWPNPIAPDNAYLTPAITPFYCAFFCDLNKDWTSQVNSHSAFGTKVKRFAAGLDGAFGSSSWTWDGYYQYGKTHRTQLVNDNTHLNAYNFALDSVIDNRPGSPTLGQPVCRVTRDGTAGLDAHTALIAQGCVPLNPFGTGPLPAAAKAYAFGYLLETLDYEQQVFAFNSTGDLFSGFGAGTIKGAAGVEYRQEKGNNRSSQDAPEWVRTDYLIQYGDSFAGDVDIYEGYVETNIPVASGVTGAQKLEFDLALRESRYDNQGGVGTTGESRSHNMTTWKISGIWDPVTWLRVRASQSRDARAANFRELYYGQTIWAGGSFGYCRPFPDQSDACTWHLEGNVNLEPEKSDTTTVGLVFTPADHLPGFQFAADYFHIKVKGAIQQASITRTLDGCRVSGIQELCDLITFDPNNPIPVAGDPPPYPPEQSNVVTVRALAFNGAAYNFSGIDFTGTYSFKMGVAGDMNLRLLATKMLEQSFQNNPGVAAVDVLGQTGNSNTFLSDNQPTADWLASLAATWVKGGWTATLQGRYVSSGTQDYLGAVPPATPPTGGRTYDTNSVPSYTIFGLNGSYTFSDLGFVKSLQIWGAIDNLFDKDPPHVGGVGPFGLSNGNGGTNPIFFDTMGRYYKLGLRAEF